MTRRILLSDTDAFFTQCARLADPEGAGRARLLIVGGPAEGRGVVTSASYEARAFGVRAGMPTARARRLCPDAVFVPVPREMVKRKSDEVFAVLRRYAPVFEPASVDEAYLDLTGTEGIYGGDLRATAHAIRAAVLAETGLTVSLGGGTSRLVAKMAVERAKPRPGGGGGDGVHIVAPGAEATFMAGFELADIPGVGPRFAERLARHGLRTVPDAQALDRATLEGWFGAREGAWLHDRVRGHDATPVTPGERARSVGREETFPRDLHGDDELHAELRLLAARAAADLRREGARARTITVKLRDADFRTRQAGTTLPEPVSADAPVLEVARTLLDRLRGQRRTGARLLGVTLSQLRWPDEDGSDAQLALFGGDAAADAGSTAAAPVETDRDRRLSAALDEVRARFGPAALRPGTATRSRPASGRGRERPAPDG
jgi:DNA polymerase IV